MSVQIVRMKDGERPDVLRPGCYYKKKKREKATNVHEPI